MSKYTLYGLNIVSSREISILSPSKFDLPDVSVSWTPEAFIPDKGNEVWEQVNTELLDLFDEITLWETTEENDRITRVDLVSQKGGIISFSFDPKNGDLRIFHEPDEIQSDLESYFVGPILSFVLRLRGQVCLHASAVEIEGKAVVFVGHSTAGKSTTAAAMANHGARILADDIVAISSSESEFRVHPGYTRVRLRPTAAGFLTPDAEALPRVYSHRDSFYYALQGSDRFESKAMPVGAIYLLGDISDDYTNPSISIVTNQEKLMKLVENASGMYVVRGERRALEFKTLSRIATSVPIRRLHYAHKIETLTKQCEIILEDFRKLNSKC